MCVFVYVCIGFWGSNWGGSMNILYNKLDRARREEDTGSGIDTGI